MELLKEKYTFTIISVVRRYDFVEPLVFRQRKLLKMFKFFYPKRFCKEAITFRYGVNDKTSRNSVSVIISKKFLLISGNPSIADEFVHFFCHSLLEMIHKINGIDISCFSLKPFTLIDQCQVAENVEEQFLQVHFPLTNQTTFRHIQMKTYRVSRTPNIIIRYNCHQRKAIMRGCLN